MRNARITPVGRPLLSRTAEHALRAALLLGARDGLGLTSAADIAVALGTPRNYTAKTLRQLTRGGILRSVRGPSGGFELRVRPSRLSIAMVLGAVDQPDRSPARCLLGDRDCDGAEPCGAHQRWQKLQRRANELLERTTVADLLGRRPDTIAT